MLDLWMSCGDAVSSVHRKSAMHPPISRQLNETLSPSSGSVTRNHSILYG